MINEYRLTSFEYIMFEFLFIINWLLLRKRMKYYFQINNCFSFLFKWKRFSFINKNQRQIIFCLSYRLLNLKNKIILINWIYFSFKHKGKNNRCECIFHMLINGRSYCYSHPFPQIISIQRCVFLQYSYS